MSIQCIESFLLVIILVYTLRAGNVIGYFPNWGIFGEKPYTAEDIPYEKLTHIQYAFFNPQISGDIASFDEYADEQNLLGRKVWNPEEQNDSTTSLVYLAHKKSVKVLASIGGWTGSKNFPALASSATARTKFCTKTRELIERYNFDGVDIDWEFPGFTDHNGTPADAQNFVLLLAELRDTLDSMIGKKKLLTLAIPASPYHGKNFLVEQFHHDVDYISIMTYDYTGSWDSYAWHSSPLYNYGSSENWSLSRSMEYYCSRGISPSKLNIGMAFYGKTFAGCDGPNTSFTGAGSGEEPGVISIAEITHKIKTGAYVRHWDTIALVPYCKSASNEYCTYDDSLSISRKAEYCESNGYAGAIIWELKSGTLSDGSSPLLDAAAKVLLSPVSIAKRPASSFSPLAPEHFTYCGSHSPVSFSTDKTSSITISMYDISGRLFLCEKRFVKAGTHTIHLPELHKFYTRKCITKITMR